MALFDLIKETTFGLKEVIFDEQICRDLTAMG